MHPGDPLKHFPLGHGDGAITDRGDGPPAGMGQALAQGAPLLVRRKPCRVVLCEPMEQPLGLGAAWKRQHTATGRPLEVVSPAPDGPQQGRGGGHA